MARFIEGNLLPPAGRFAICAARFNSLVTEALIQGALDVLLRHQVDDSRIDVYRVPGAFELLGLVQRVCEGGEYSGLIALGAVIRGGTPHFDLLSSTVTSKLGDLAAGGRCAVSLGVLTCDTLEQALDRAGGKAGNKGVEAATACIEMVNLFAQMGQKRKRR